MNFSLAVKAKSAAKRSRRQQFDIVRQSKEAGNKLQEEEDRVRQFYKANGLEYVPQCLRSLDECAFFEIPSVCMVHVSCAS